MFRAVFPHQTRASSPLPSASIGLAALLALFLLFDQAGDVLAGALGSSCRALHTLAGLSSIYHAHGSTHHLCDAVSETSHLLGSAGITRHVLLSRRTGDGVYIGRASGCWSRLEGPLGVQLISEREGRARIFEIRELHADDKGDS